MLKQFVLGKKDKNKHAQSKNDDLQVDKTLQGLTMREAGAPNDVNINYVGDPAAEKREGKLHFEVVCGFGLPGRPDATPQYFIQVSVEHNHQPTPPANPGCNPQWKYLMQFDLTQAANAWNGLIDVKLHDRTRLARGEDLIGRAFVRPPFGDEERHEVSIKLWNDNFTHQLDGELKLALQFKASDYSNQPLNIEDFELLKVVGKGSFGKVVQVRKKDTNRIYAMKILRKSHLIERDEVGHTKSERHILERNTNPFLVGLKFSFQTPEKLYLVLDYVNGGELFYHLQLDGKFSLDRSKFYTAQLLTAIDDLHKMNVIYRDLKPENILIDHDGYIALTDFGLCKENVKYDETTNTFCGTPEYMAPEVLQQKGYGPAVDWWTLGILLYEMLTGLPPFYDESTHQMYHKILYSDLDFTEEVPPNGQTLIAGLLQRDPKQRLGYGVNGAENVKHHPFFSDINWELLLAKKLRAPWRPQLENQLDVSNFDPEFTQMVPQDSVVADSHLLDTKLQDQFQGFTYIDESEYLKNTDK